MHQEFGDITTSPPPGCTVKLAKDDDLNLWDVVMQAPAESVYSVMMCLARLRFDIHN